MNRGFFGAGAFAFLVTLAASAPAFAQELAPLPAPSAPAAAPAAPAPAVAAPAAPAAAPVAPTAPAPPPPQAPQYTPEQEAPPPAAQWTYSYPTGQWVYTTDYGWIWVPNGAGSVAVEGVPYTYLYTRGYGWNWYVSPWGVGPYRYGVWVRHPWRPVGWRGGWVAHPRVAVHLGSVRRGPVVVHRGPVVRGGRGGHRR